MRSCTSLRIEFGQNGNWEKGKKFKTRFGRGIGFETINDTVIKLSQKMGYVIVVRKDPRKGYVRVKAKPLRTQTQPFGFAQGKNSKLKTLI